MFFSLTRFFSGISAALGALAVAVVAIIAFVAFVLIHFGFAKIIGRLLREAKTTKELEQWAEQVKTGAAKLKEISKI
jgi:sensor histidine kinase YesM